MPATLDRSTTALPPDPIWEETISRTGRDIGLGTAEHEASPVSIRMSAALYASPAHFAFYLGQHVVHGGLGTAFLGLPSMLGASSTGATHEFDSSVTGSLFFNTRQDRVLASQVLRVDPPSVIQEVALDALDFLRSVTGGAAAYLTIVSVARDVASKWKLSGRISLRLLGDGDERELIVLVVFTDTSRNRKFELLRMVADSYGMYLNELSEDERGRIARFLRLQVDVDAGTR